MTNKTRTIARTVGVSSPSMKPTMIPAVVALLILGTVMPAQESNTSKKPRVPAPVGSWIGSLDVGAMKLRLVIHIKSESAGMSATLDSPDQGAKGIAVDSVSFEDGVLKFAIQRLRASYEGKWNEGTQKFDGTFRQGQELPLVLTRLDGEAVPRTRPQNPREPYPYGVEEVYYSHDPSRDTAESFRVVDANTVASGHVRLAATLTTPKTEGPHPAVVLISGSGPQDRDESLLGHKPFLVLADAMTRRGIAVLRFDDRGTAKSTGDHESATSADFAKDAHAGLLYLLSRKDIDAKKIGLMGHSEGALIAPMVAATAPKAVAFVVMLAGPGVAGEEIIVLQSRLMGKAAGATEAELEFGDATNRRIFAALREEGDASTTRERLHELLAEAFESMPEQARAQVGTKKAFVAQRLERLTTPWFRYFLAHDPAPVLQKLRCPVLALNGQRDLQVAPDQNLPAIRKALAANQDTTVLELPGLNHLFQNCKTGAVSEYAEIEETFDPATLARIGDWIAKRFL